MVETSYILDGLKQALIHYINPSELSDDPNEGLREKENLISSLNQCVLQENIPEINELEELVANTIKSNFTSLLLDRMTYSDIQNELPTLELGDVYPAHGSSSSSSSGTIEDIIVGEENYMVSYLSGGSYDINLFDQWTWTVLNGPEDGTVEINDGWDEPSDTDRYRAYFMSFTKPGLYLLSLRVTYPFINVYVQSTLSVRVTEFYELEIT